MIPSPSIVKIEENLAVHEAEIIVHFSFKVRTKMVLKFIELELDN